MSPRHPTIQSCVCLFLGIGLVIRTAEAQQVAVELDPSPRNLVESKNELTDLACSADGRYFATAGADGRVRLYDTQQRNLVAVTPANSSTTACLAFSADGGVLAVGGYDGQAALLTVPDLTVRTKLLGHSAPVLAIAVSTDGDRVASGSYDKTARLWDASTGQQLKKYDAGSAVRTVEFTADGTGLVLGEQDGTVQVVESGTLRPMFELDGAGSVVRDTEMTPDGSRLAVGYGSGHIQVWNVAQRESDFVQRLQDAAHSVSLSSAGATLAVGLRDGSIQTFDVNERVQTATMAHHDDAVSAVQFLDGDEVLLSAGLDGRVFGWNSRVKLQSAFVRMETDYKVWSMAVSDSVDMVATGGRGGVVELRDRSTARLLRRCAPHPQTVDRLRFSSDGRLLAGASWKSQDVLIWDVATGALRRTFKCEAVARDMDFSPDDQQLAIAQFDGTLSIRAVVGDDVRAANVDGVPAYDVAYSPDGALLAACSGDWPRATPGVIRLLNADDLKTLRVLKGHESAVRGLAFAPSGQLLASCGEDGSIRIWNVATGATERTLRGADPLRAVAFSRDGKWLAAAADDGTVSVWNTERETVIQRLRGGADMFCAGFTSDGTALWGAGGDRAFRFWQFQPGEHALTPPSWLQKWAQETQGTDE